MLLLSFLEIIFIEKYENILMRCLRKVLYKGMDV